MSWRQVASLRSIVKSASASASLSVTMGHFWRTRWATENSTSLASSKWTWPLTTFSSHRSSQRENSSTSLSSSSTEVLSAARVLWSMPFQGSLTSSRLSQKGVTPLTLSCFEMSWPPFKSCRKTNVWYQSKIIGRMIKPFTWSCPTPRKTLSLISSKRQSLRQTNSTCS